MSGVRVVVHGRVQGVGFRISARRAATAAGVSGWVRNRPDRTVEAVVGGEEDAVETMLAWLREGPPAARVDRVEVETIDDPPTGPFEIR